MKIELPFMKILVCGILVYVIYLTERAFSICEHIGVSPEACYIAAVGFFGTELFLTMWKKVSEHKRSKKLKKDKGEC